MTPSPSSPPPHRRTSRFGARLDVLHALAKADFPDYDKHEAAYIALADSIGAPNGLDAQTVLDDVKASAGGDTPFAATRTAAKLPHSATAFVGEEICNTARVVVDGKAATWIFSEFETDAPFAQLARWVDPRNWPDNAPMMFKRMELIGGEITALTGLEVPEHWHGEFLEEVQLVQRLKTLLHCDYYADPGTAVGMTYDLTFSVEDQIIVDRGFLLASDIGGGAHRVRGSEGRRVRGVELGHGGNVRVPVVDRLRAPGGHRRHQVDAT